MKVSGARSSKIFIIKVKRGALAPRVLAERTSAYIAARNLAYPNADAKPKHHYAMHIPENEVMIDCFVHERKHKDFKGFGEKVFDPSLFCRSLMAHALWQQAKMRTCKKLAQPTYVGAAVIWKSITACVLISSWAA